MPISLIIIPPIVPARTREARMTSSVTSSTASGLVRLPPEDALRHSWAAVVRDCPNVYADLASSIAPMGGFEALVDMVGARKVLYGSDAPLHDMAYQIGRVLFAKMSDEDKADILGHNLERLIGQVTDTG